MNTGKPGYLFIGANNDGSRSGFKYTDAFQKDIGAMRGEGNILPQLSTGGGISLDLRHCREAGHH